MYLLTQSENVHKVVSIDIEPDTHTNENFVAIQEDICNIDILEKLFKDQK